MPNKPSWLLRVNEILEDLGGEEMAAHPFLTRAAAEKPFGLKRRQAIQLMHSVGGYPFRCELDLRSGKKDRSGGCLNRIAQMPADERADVFAEAAERQGLPEAIIEKDFWVCWVLKQLFSIEALSGRLLFKGGTSLSKIFHAINRFSEDIDLAVDYAALGFTGERDPRREEISKTRRARILTEMMAECQRYIDHEFLDALQTRCQEVLGTAEAWSRHASLVMIEVMV